MPLSRSPRISRLGSKRSKISVVLVVHDRYRPLLPVALRSLRAQTVPHETILIDGTGLRLAEACNLGCAEATGRYLIRLDADDWIEPGLLDIEAEHLDEHPEIDAVWCDFIESREIAPGLFSLEITPQETLEHACGVMMRREVWERLKYDESLDFQEGFDFWCRFRRAGFRAARLPVPAYFYRRHAGSMSTNPERERVRAELERKYIAC